MTGGELVPAPPVVATRLPPRARSLGERSRRMKVRLRLRKLARATAAAVTIWVAAVVAGFVMNGLGTAGLIATFFLMIAAFAALLVFPRLRVPGPADLVGSDLAGLAGSTELFLEAQRPQLPPPAQALLDRIGGGLDQLSPQLATLGEQDPAAHEARRLLGEHLPALIASYTRIPAELRGREHAGATPEQQLTGGLETIARGIDTMAGDIARGDLDALATRGRYLEAKYVGDADTPPGE